MGAPVVTYSFINGQTSDGTQVSQNFTDILNAITDGSKDLSVNKVTATTSLISPVFQSTNINVAAAGVIRLANTDIIGWRNAANSADITLTVNSSNNFVFSSSVLTGNGSGSNVAYGFSAEINTGMWRSGASLLDFNVAGTEHLQLGSGTILGFGPFLNSTGGSAVACSFSFSSNVGTGIYLFAANSLGFASNGVTAGHIDSSQNWTIPGSATVNSVAVGSSANTISACNTLSSAADMTVGPTTANNLNFATNGTSWVRTNSTGNMAFGTVASIATTLGYIFDSTSITGMTGTAQTIFKINAAATSAATATITGALIQTRTVSSVTTTSRIGLEVFNSVKAGGSSLTNDVCLCVLVAGLGGTANAGISDSSTPATGTWWLYQSGTNASQFNGSVVIASGALATNATDGFIYIDTCAGTPTGVPTTRTGTAALIYDTTNNKLAVYNGAWKQTAALT